MIRLRSRDAGAAPFREAAARVADIAARDALALKAGAEEVAVRATDFARAYAPWTDRTGAARRGLHPITTELERGAAGGVSHDTRLDYVGALETKSGGRFGIIPRAQEVQTQAAPPVFAAALNEARRS